ncbi:phosphate ABC transporter permease PstA [Plectonema cf. radiosum LEGE 06105]|uniref:Phosphate transport system permease protein PstA n=1 Tax=Plectonema cf. radiosum LEGE 06105 TaxID=945769 RepID=A0A8J7F130_9CYAN|nr:phosphate ABC transporter permease PstA [Plectonema radiosum]MBE9212807.1 phosphate ABC transporter permease PstA [Plectonema cf. radiosum LEGE 06105]
MSASKRPEIDLSVAREVCSPLSPERFVFQYGMTFIAFFLTFLALLPLFSLIWVIFARGLSNLRPEMFVKQVVDFGFANAIVGTIKMVGIASLFSIPLGVITGIFLSEFGKDSKIYGIVRFFTTVLSGVPSIVVGVFAYGVFVITTKQFSAVAGGFALAIIMLPIIALTTEQVLKLVPNSLRLASAALGGNRFQTTFKVVLAAGLPGITTAILLAIARASGETAPLLFTALFSDFWTESLLRPTASLPVLIYRFYQQDDPQIFQLIWTASIVLVSLVFLLNLLSRVITSKKR